jgi:hypothetical protein
MRPESGADEHELRAGSGGQQFGDEFFTFNTKLSF